MALKEYLLERQSLVEKALHGYVPKASVKPATMHKAMRYSLFAGGKRLRPVPAVAPDDPAPTPLP